MTSHYMRCLVKGSFEKVFDALSRGFGNIYSRRLGKSDEPQTGVILGGAFLLQKQ
jgi:hypothetical protein